MNPRTTSAQQQDAHPRNQADLIRIIAYSHQTTTIKNRITLQQNLFSFLLEGEKTVFYAGTSVQIKPGQFLLLSAGNCMMSEKAVGQSGRYQSLLISFDNKLLADFFGRYSTAQQAPVGPMAEEPFLRFERDGFLTNYVESLHQLLLVGGAVSPSMRLIKLEELLVYLNEAYPGQLQRLQAKSQEASDELRIRQAVTASMDQPVTVEELAFLCHTSLSTFKRRFAKLYGTSPTRWLLERRMQKAARLLSQEQRKASEIYDELGYENLSSFIQSFKQAYGVTPKQYQLSGQR